MDMKPIIDYVRANLYQKIPPKPGQTYSKKPDGYMTFDGWLKQGKVPVDVIENAEVFLLKGGPDGYTYFSEDVVRPLTKDECRQLDELKVEHSTNVQNNDSKKGRVFGSFFKDRQPTNKVNLTRQAPKSNGNTSRFKIPEDSILKKFPNMAEIGGKKVYTVKVETNGTNPSKDDILRVIIVGRHENGEYGEIQSPFFRPTKRKTWDATQQKISGITPEMLAAAPSDKNTIRYMIAQIQKQLNEVDYIATYDAGFHIEFLRKCFGLHIPDKKVLDVKEMFQKHYPGEASYKMGDAVKKYIPGGVKNYYNHQSDRNNIYDAQVMHSLFEIQRMAIQEEQQKAIADMKEMEELDERER